MIHKNWNNGNSEHRSHCTHHEDIFGRSQRQFRIHDQRFASRGVIYTENAFLSSEIQIRLRIAGFGYTRYQNIENTLHKSVPRKFCSESEDSDKRSSDKRGLTLLSGGLSNLMSVMHSLWSWSTRVISSRKWVRGPFDTLPLILARQTGP